jgi:Tol biopolymer transport system component
MAQPFDAGTRRTTGDPVAIVTEPIGQLGPPLLSASQTGVLVYASGARGGTVQLTWFDQSGKPIRTVGEPGRLQNPAISPDGTRVAFGRAGSEGWEIWLRDLALGHESRFNSGRFVGIPVPVWSFDGNDIAFSDRPTGGGSIVYRRATSGGAPDEVLDGDDRVKRAVGWSHDDRYIVEEVQDTTKGGSRIWAKPLFGDRKPFPYLNSEYNEIQARLSPDGHRLAYVSDASRRNEVYVGTFPTPGLPQQISVNGGYQPVWSRDGKKLFYISADRRMMAVEIKSGDKPAYGTPVPLFLVHLDPLDSYDVSKDGRFLIPVPVAQGAAPTINVVINWQAGLKK